MGSKKQETNQTQVWDSTQHGTEHRENFTSPEMQERYNWYSNAAQDNYQNAVNNANKINGILDSFMQKGGIGDTSYFKQAWDQAQGIDQSNLKKINSMSVNPNDNKDWVSAQDAIDRNAMLNWGKTLNQMNMNILGSGMVNGSNHQTAAARTAALLNSQLASDRANRWQEQYNHNMQNTMAANNQLGNFYNTLANIGIDYARLNQQDLSTLLNAYNGINNAQSAALGQLGQAVQMGSDPTTTTDLTEHRVGNINTVNTSKPSWGDYLGGALALGTGFLKK